MAEVTIKEAEDKETTIGELPYGALFEMSSSPHMKVNAPKPMQAEDEERKVRAVSLRTGLIIDVNPKQTVFAYPPSTLIMLHNERKE